jgi:hypothetical protein
LKVLSARCWARSKFMTNISYAATRYKKTLRRLRRCSISTDRTKKKPRPINHRSPASKRRPHSHLGPKFAGHRGSAACSKSLHRRATWLLPLRFPDQTRCV